MLPAWCDRATFVGEAKSHGAVQNGLWGNPRIDRTDAHTDDRLTPFSFPDFTHFWQPREMTSRTTEQLKENLERVRMRIAAACARSGRAVDSVTLIAVTKYAELNWVRSQIGLRDIWSRKTSRRENL